MKYKTRYELLLEDLKNYQSYMEMLLTKNPELAKKASKDALTQIGIIDEAGNLKPPYNGEKVNPDDFERGPKKVLKGKNY